MPVDKETGMAEPDVTINGRALTFQESMAVRVACSMMAIQLDDLAFRLRLGERLAAGYSSHLGTVAKAMLAPRPDPDEAAVLAVLVLDALADLGEQRKALDGAYGDDRGASYKALTDGMEGDLGLLARKVAGRP